MKIRTNITILINEYLLRNITRYEQYYNLSLVSYKFIILNLSFTITFIKLGTFFASKSQGGATPLPESVRGRMSPRPLYPPLFLQSLLLLFVTQNLVLRQSKNVTAKYTETLSPPPSIEYLLGLLVYFYLWSSG